MRELGRKRIGVVLIGWVLAASCVQAADSIVVFNEVMYHPREDAGIEWIELHNLLALDVDVSKWSIRGGVEYSFPVGTLIPAHGFLVVAKDPEAFSLMTGADTVYGPFSGNLSNSGERLELVNNDHRLMDAIDYEDGGEWPVAPDGSGVTLAKRRPTMASGSPVHWTWSTQAGGTPGAANFPDDDIAPVGHEVVGLQGEWRYDDSGGDQGSLWRQADYDDGDWAIGQAAFFSGQPGVGDTPTAITTLYSTGLAENGAVLSPGQTDPHYVVTSTGAPLTVMQNHPAWAPNDAGSMWIGLSAQGTDNQPPGDYSFSTTFDLTGWLADTASLSFTVAVDNELLDVRINGLGTGITSVGHDAFHGPFIIQSGFVSGVNQIDFVFTNWSTSANPMGLRIHIAGTAVPVLGHTSVAEGPVTHYFRKPFVYSGDPQSAVTVNLNYLVDDGAVFYLNGQEIHRTNMPGGTVQYGTTAASDVADPQLSGFMSIPVTNLAVGHNVLAVEVHQSDQDNDVLFAAGVTVTETPRPSVEPVQVAYNELAAARDEVFWLELVNHGEAPVDLTGFVVACAGQVDAEYTIPAGALPAGGYLVLDGATLGFRPADEDRLFLYPPGQDAVSDAVVVKNSHRGRYPEAIGRWQYPDVPTLGAENHFDFNRDVVINEIMYHRCYVPRQGAQYDTSLILHAGAPARTYVPADNTYGMRWTGAEEPFDDTLWTAGTGSTTGIGYERGQGYEDWIGTDVHDAMYGVNRSVYVRIPFEIADVGGVDGLTLKMKYDDAFIAYINGREVARSAYAPTLVRWDSGADNGHEATGFESFDVTEHKDVLVEGQNILAIHGFNYGTTSSDMIILPELEVRQQISPGAPGGESAEEWVELYNKGDGPVDLSGWEFQDAIRFVFPQGTVLGPGEYIVVAHDGAALAMTHPTIPVVGQYEGRLSNKGERILLVDNHRNIADEVHYFDGKPWPGAADGHYASLELRDPDADNARAAAWRASDESARTSWKTYTYRATATASPVGPDGQWQEFVLGLLDAGEILLDDISVIEDPDGAAIELIQNRTFESGTADTWRLLGNHGHSEIMVDPDDPTNRVLRLVATGPVGHLHNHAETTLAGGRSIVNGRTYEVSFRAKWIAGSNQLNCRLYFNRVARTTLIEPPDRSGTPGTRNSRYEGNIGPTFTDLVHSPPVPSEDDPVTVCIQADDPDGVAAVTLQWRVDGQTWNSVPMTLDNGGRVTAQIPALPQSTVVQFYVQATDGTGRTSTYPPDGPDSRALYKVNDGLAADNGLHNFRIIMLADDYDWMHTDINLMSDDRMGATVIYEEREVYYDAGVRLKSSQRHRHEAANVGFNVRFGADRPFNDIHETVALDRSEGVTPGQREMLIHLAMNRAGSCQLSKYSDMVKVIAPAIQHTGSAELQLARYNTVFLDDQFVDGGDGEVFEYEYVYYPYTTRSGDPEDYKLPLPDGVVGGTIRDFGDDKENYRWQFLKKNNRDEDDYQGLINFAKVFGTTGPYFNDHVSDVADVDQWLRAFAIAVACGAGDSYGGDNSQHNMQIYIRPSDGRALYFPHDLDAFYSATRPLVANSDLQKMLASPGYERLYYGHVHDILRTSYNTTYMQHWTDQIGGLLPSQAFGSHLSFIGQRNSFLAAELANRIAPEYPFEITEYDPIVAKDHATVSGRGWINVKEVYLDGVQPPLRLAWTSTGSGTTKVFHWSTSVPLEPGENSLTFRVYDFQGDLIATKTLSITSTVVERPLRDYLRVTEVMYNPIGGTDFEFIELYNSGPQTLDLSGLKMVQDEVIRFDFDAGTVSSLAPDDYVLIVNDLAAFALRYDTANMNVAGEFSGNLSNGGETFTFTGRWDSLILSLDYGDGRVWPLAADGAGHSLVPLEWVIAADPDGLLDYGGNWRASTYIHGSPGRADPVQPATLLLNEIMAHTDYSDPDHPEYDSNDWIELYNPTGAPVVMAEGCWFLSDDAEDLQKWSIPAAVIPAHGWTRFDEVTGFHNPLTTGFGLDKAGEELYLSYLPGTGEDGVVDCMAFKAQSSDASLGRYPDGGAFWYSMAPSPGSTNSHPLDHVVISELMYRPLEGMPEYIELHNPTMQPVHLWDAEAGCGWRLDGGISFAFSQDTVIPAGGYLVIVPFEPDEAGLAGFRSAYGDRPSVILGPYEGRLADHGERVAMERPEAADVVGQEASWAIVDEVIYFDKTPWTTEAAGTGLALCRLRPDRHGSDPDAWAARSPRPGTVFCDFDKNGRVDLLDWSCMAAYWMAEATDPDWNAEVDLDHMDSDVIDGADMRVLLHYWLWNHE